MLRRVQEFEAVERIIDQNEAARQVRQQQQDIPICTVDDRRSADGVIFGSPTRYGSMMAQMKQLIDTSRKQSLYREIAPNAVNVAF
ncbi:MAG: NAD(P)H dehydrogenase (quinone) [Chroococcidiopsis sp. SAG 2025]|uniref:NAD(P)H-dependent oxidoreductase n=1 Tax=Chroococcidiopsis sp. SAG 2025 TaxID=171389 RepID=UPI0029384104|nr:NAD(P)H dehydrogenase (quinone) [Chroococcidiopsis sp. SAG 2025]